MRRRGVLTIVLVLAMASLAPGADDFVVIVHPSVAGTQMRRADLATLFLRGRPRAGAGESRQCRWTSRGFRPPAVKGSDAEVVAFVAKTEGAVGYVSKAAALPPEVKAVAVID